MFRKNIIAGIAIIILVVVIGGAYSTYAQEISVEATPGVFTRVGGVSKTIANGNANPSVGTALQISMPMDMSEGFEGSWPATDWVLADPSSADGGEYLLGKRDCHPHTGSYAGWFVGGGAQGSALDCADNYVDNMETWAVYGPFDLTDATDASLTFYLWGESEYEDTCLYDYLYLGSSTDGSSYSNGMFYCGDWTDGIDGNGYHLVTYDLNARLGESQVWIGFSFVSDYSNSYRGFTIDDLALNIDNTPTTSTSTPTSTATTTSTTTSTATPTNTPTSTPTPTPTATNTQSSLAHLLLPLVFNKYPAGPVASPTKTPISPIPSDTPTPTPTATATLPALPTDFIVAADSYVDQNNPSQNHGNDWGMNLGFISKHGLVQFDISEIPPGTNINQATLVMNYVGGNPYGLTYSLTAHRISSNWDEMTVTWESQPSYAEAYDTVNISTYGRKYFDVTSLVQAWVDGTYPNYGIMLLGTNVNGFTIYCARGVGSTTLCNSLDSVSYLTISYGSP